MPQPNPSLKKQSSNTRSIGKSLFRNTFLVLVGISTLLLLWFFFLPSGIQLRNVMADTIITTQHRDWAKYLIGSKELQKRVEAYWGRFEEYAVEEITEKADIPTFNKVAVIDKPLIDIQPISGKGFKGYLMTISDPKKVRIVVPEKYGKGEKVTSMVKRMGALAGVNGGGFIDPEWKGNGFQPEGIVMSGGHIFYHDQGMDVPIHVVGIDKEGQMIAGKYSPNQLLNMRMSEAVSFSPRFIVNGVGQIKNQADGWGIAPRTCMAQKQDGSIMFAILDGRQPTYSMGASLYDVQQILLENGAIIAANLDGGSSTVLVKENQIINRPSSEHGERYLPTAWLVFEEPNKTVFKNVWEGVDIKKINPSTW